MSEENVRLGLIASGSGTDANAIMSACRDGRIRNAEPVLLISSKADAGCLDQAAKNRVLSATVDRKSYKLTGWQAEVARLLGIRNYRVELVFLVGCVVVFEPIEGVPFYNIHPADPIKHGGRKMYGLDVHKHVLTAIKDEIKRGMKKPTDRFFTYPTVHEVIGKDKPDQGLPLLQASVEIPSSLIQKLMAEVDPLSLDTLSAELQQHVLPYEWLILPTAVEMAAKKILDRRK